MELAQERRPGHTGRGEGGGGAEYSGGSGAWLDLDVCIGVCVNGGKRKSAQEREREGERERERKKEREGVSCMGGSTCYHGGRVPRRKHVPLVMPRWPGLATCVGPPTRLCSARLPSRPARTVVCASAGLCSSGTAGSLAAPPYQAGSVGPLPRSGAGRQLDRGKRTATKAGQGGVGQADRRQWRHGRLFHSAVAHARAWARGSIPPCCHQTQRGQHSFGGRWGL